LLPISTVAEAERPCAADLASLCARPPVQRIGGHPARASPVTTGLYRVIRHPSYSGLLVNSLSWALAFRSGVGVLLTALLTPPLIARIRAEERLLRVHA
ncbi:MAG TPA: methyltransferase, partial [Candidatus Binataceae bacterium]